MREGLCDWQEEGLVTLETMGSGVACLHSMDLIGPRVLEMIALVTARRKEVRWGWTCPSREIPEGGAASHASQLGHFNLS